MLRHPASDGREHFPNPVGLGEAQPDRTFGGFIRQEVCGAKGNASTDKTAQLVGWACQFAVEHVSDLSDSSRWFVTKFISNCIRHVPGGAARTIPHALGSSHVVGRTAQTSPPFATHARKTSTGLCISRNFTRDQRIPSALHGAILPLLRQGNHKTQGPNNLPTGDDYAGVVTQYDLKTKASLC